MAKYTINDTTLTSIADAIRAKGGTSAALTPSQMAEAIAAIQAGGGDSNGIDALSYMPESYDGSVTKEFLPVPDFTYAYAYTNTSNALNLNIEANPGDTVLAAFAMRKLSAVPPAPDGWELFQYCEPHPDDTSYLQSLVVFKKTANNSGFASITMNQEDSSQRFYGFVCNIKDSKIGSSAVQYNEMLDDQKSGTIQYTYENTLMFTTNALSIFNKYSNQRPNGICFDGSFAPFHPKFAYGDDAAEKYQMYSSRLSCMYRPFGSRQNSSSNYFTIRMFNNSLSTTGIGDPYIHLLIEILPGKDCKWVTASDEDTTFVYGLEGHE